MHFSPSMAPPHEKFSGTATDPFYEQLQAVVEGVRKHYLLIVMGDLNAKVGDK